MAIADEERWRKIIKRLVLFNYAFVGFGILPFYYPLNHKMHTNKAFYLVSTMCSGEMQTIVLRIILPIGIHAVFLSNIYSKFKEYCDVAINLY